MPGIENKSRLSEIIQLLTNATERGSLHWEGTPDEDEFRADLSSGQVRLNRISNLPFGYSSAVSAEDKYSLAMLNQRSQVIDSFTPTDSEDMKALGTLFGMVRRRALNLDVYYESLLTELKNRAGK